MLQSVHKPRYRPRRGRSVLSLSLALLLLTAACSQRDDDDSEAGPSNNEGGGGEIDTANCQADPTAEIEGDTIELVSSYPQSGITAAFSEIASGWQAYFDMVNNDGGVEIDGNSYQIEWQTMDDQYDASRTAQNISEMVGDNGDGAFAAFSVVGTANNLAIRDQLANLCVPNLFAATGAPAWGDPDYPWTIGSSLSPYSLEAEVFFNLLQDQKPDARVAMLIQDDDFGRAYRETFENLIEDSDIELVKVETYQAGVQTDVSAQMTSLASSDADVFFNGATLLACPDALSRAANAGWQREITWVSSTCLSKTLMGIAGAAGDGVYSIANIKDPQSPDWADDQAMQDYKDTVAAWGEANNVDVDVDNSIVAYGWTQAAALVQALEAADAPTRLAVMEAVHNLDLDDGTGLLLPDTNLHTSSDDDDNFMGEQVYLVQYDFAGTHFATVGDAQDFDGETADFTPSALISEGA